MKNFMKVYSILVNMTTYMPSFGNFLMNNTKDIQAEKIDNAPMVCLSGLHLGRRQENPIRKLVS